MPDPKKKFAKLPFKSSLPKKVSKKNEKAVLDYIQQMDMKSYNTGSIRKSDPKQAKLDKSLEVLLNPMTAMGYMAKNKDLPDNFSRGPRNKLDYAVDVINPAQYVNDTKNVAQGAYNKDGMQFAEGLLGVAPIPLAGKAMKKVNKKVKSEINWSKFNKEIPSNKLLMKEYDAIEKSSKAKGSWMKNSDGSTFTGTSEQFVQQNSSNFKKAFPNIIKDNNGNIQTNFHGSPNEFNEFVDNLNSSDKTGERLGKGIYTTPKRGMALQYAFKNKNKKGKLYELYQNSDNPQNLIENFEKLQDLKTNNISKILKNKKATTKQIKQASKDFNKIIKDQENFYDNLKDSDFKLQKNKDFFKSGEEQVVPFTNHPKSMKGNNGMFDMTNPNIYKALVPATIGLSAIKSNATESINQEKKMKPKKITKRKAVPKYALGALISTGVGLLTSSMAANKANNAAKKAEKRNQNLRYNEELNNDAIESEEYQKNIANSTTNYYQAKGGKLANTPASYTKGGKLKPLSSDMVIAKGNKHNESKIDNTSGIKLMKGGKAIAEIEDDETIKDGKKVYSDRLTVDGNTTFAEAAANTATAKASFEQSGNKKQVEVLDKQEDALFEQQESMKKNTKTSKTSIPKAKNGKLLDSVFGQLGKNQSRGSQIGEAVTPFIDNIGNAILTSKTSKLPAPNLQRAKSLKTSVNVNPQLDEINKAVATSSQFIGDNTSNSSTARSQVASTRLQGATAKARVFANKENTETQLENQNTQNIQRITGRNLDKLDSANMRETMRADSIAKRTSANLANLSDDFTAGINRRKKEEYQDQFLKTVNEGTTGGVGIRQLMKVDLSHVLKNVSHYWAKVKGTADEAEFLRQIGKTAEELDKN